MTTETPYQTVDIERRGIGRRYTWLPVDTRSREAFSIDCSGAYVRPEMYDIRPGDVVRWREGERLIEGVVGAVQRVGEQIDVRVDGAALLPVEAFHP